MKKIPFPVLKLIAILLHFIPFLLCWILWYEPRSITVGSKQVFVLINLVYICILYYLCQKQDCYRVAVLQIRDIIFGQIISAMVTDVIAYITIWMVSVHMPHLWPGLLAFAVQCMLAPICAIILHRGFFATHTPMKTVIIYDERIGLDELIHSYGLEHRFDIKNILPIEEIASDFSQLDNYEAAFLVGVHYQERNEILKYSIDKGIKVYLVPRIADVMLRGAERLHMMHLPMLKSQRTVPTMEYRCCKRLMDVICSGLALIVLSPIMLATAIAVKADGGPAFYRQRRLTKDGKVFEILKFRSMCVDAEKYSGAVLSAGENDPRITKVGHFIRDHRIDELPQLINILRGDMSIVGPRPERPEIQAQIMEELPAFALRLQVKAGLTGYAQVYGKYNTTFYDKLLMDLMYVSHTSILEDINLILATVKILFSKDSVEGIGEATVELRQRENATKPVGALCVAVVDDNEIQRNCAEEILKQYSLEYGRKIEVKSYQSGEAFVSAINAGCSFDLCFLDVVMPGMSGIETARLMRQKGDSTRIVFLSSTGDYALEGYRVKATDYLIKPLEWGHLVGLLEDTVS